jgi:dCMP deaminase
MFLIKDKFIHYYMDVARETSKLSTATKLKVGAVLVKNDNIIGFSYNGMPRGWDNVCEYIDPDIGLKTKPEVSHAEENLIMKLACSHESSEGGIMFVTHNPCYVCARLIYGAKIKKVIYENDYRDSSGIHFLKDCGIEVEKYGRK